MILSHITLLSWNMFPIVLLVLGLLLRMDVESYQRLFLFSFFTFFEMIMILFFFCPCVWFITFISYLC